MNNEAEKYLQEINRRLTSIPKQDREDILLEIKNHIYEAEEKGENIVEIISRLGSPIKLAQAYSLGYSTEYQKLKPSDVLNNLSFYVLAGFSGIVVIPLLSFLSVTFLVIAIIIPGMAITNLFGFTQISMFVWGEASISPGILQLALGVLVGAVFVYLTYLCWSGIKGYIKEISKDYRKLKVGK